MNYHVQVNGAPVEVYTSTSRGKPYNHTTSTSFATFSMDVSCDIVITPDRSIEQVVIRPKSLHLSYRVEGHDILIHLEKPAKFSVELNGSIDENILIFANAKRNESINLEDEKVMYFPKGVHQADVIDLTGDNLTLYFEEGAFVHGKLRANGCQGLKICGTGVLCSERYDREDRKYQLCMELNHCKNLTIQDVTLSDSSAWSMRIFGCDDVHIDNVNILGNRGNSDGFDICGSRNVLVEKCFTRTADDSFVLKAFDTGDVHHIVYRDSTLWNDSARPIEIGVELRADAISDVTFENIDVIHSVTGYPVMGIHHGDRAKISNITFSNIRIEDAPGAQIFDIRITDSVWNKDKQKGGINGVTIKDIAIVEPLVAPMSNSRIAGFSKDVQVENVTIENITYLGKQMDLLELNKLDILDHVSGVNVKPVLPDNRILPVPSVLTMKQPFVLNAHGYYEGLAAITLSNPNLETIQGRANLQVSPKNTVHTEGFSYILQPGESICQEYPLTLQPGKYVLTVQSDDVGVESRWELIDLPCQLATEIAQAPTYRIYNYYGNTLDDVQLAMKDDRLLIQSDALAENEFVVYAANLPTPEKGLVQFTVEETDFGEATPIVDSAKGLAPAPQLRNPMEVWMVFKIQPKVKEVREIRVGGKGQKQVILTAQELGIEGEEFLLELQADLPETKQYRYPFTLFHSVNPQINVHMFARLKRH